MSFHQRLNERGAARQHLNRAHNLNPRTPADVLEGLEFVKHLAAADAETAKEEAKSLAAAASASAAAARASASAAAAARAKTASTISSSTSSSIASATNQVFPVPKGTNPFGITFTPSSSSSTVASIPTSAAPLAKSIPPVVVSSQSTSVHSASTAPKEAPTVSPTSNGTSASTAETVDASSKGLSSGAVGAIVAIMIIVVAGICAFVARKMYRRRREQKRNTWGAGLVPALENKRGTLYGNDAPSVTEKSTTFSPSTAPSTIPPSPAQISVPPALYNSSASVPFVPSTLQAPSNHMASAPTPAVEVAVVVRTFVPNLPDELHISTGEHIRVLSAFDDGWALCANIRGDQGVVPLECLQRGGNHAQMEMQLQPESEFGYDSNRAAKRLSSLVPNSTGTY